MGVDERLLQDPAVKRKVTATEKTSARRTKLEEQLEEVKKEQSGQILGLLEAGLTTRFVGTITGLSHSGIIYIRDSRTEPQEGSKP